MSLRLGVLSDTHGKLTAAAAAALAGIDRIVHAGDVGDLAVLVELREIAPVVAVRGNTDTGETAVLPHEARFEAEGVSVYVTHDPGAARAGALGGADLVIVGHTHRAALSERGGTTWLNPGSATQGRGRRPSIALVTLAAGRVQARIVTL